MTQVFFTIIETSTEDVELADLGYLYGFIQELKSLCVSGLARRSSPCRELVSNQGFDISLFKSLQKFQVRNTMMVYCGWFRDLFLRENTMMVCCGDGWEVGR